MKAIETRYKGYRFRSRLEARWAVFFDTLGVAWQYEAEGFELSGGVHYLPDFLLGKVLWVEVKATAPNADEQKKAELLAAESDMPVAIGVGEPVFGADLWVYCMDTTDGSGGWSWWTDGRWRAFKGKNLLCIALDAGRDDRTFVDGEWGMSGIIARAEDTEPTYAVMRAADMARSARFEHGEKPRP